MLFTDKQFQNLTEAKGDDFVSIYLPTDHAGDGSGERQRFKELVREANDRLQERGQKKEQAHQFLHRAYEMLDDDDFWDYLSDGLAVFISEKNFQHFTLPVDFKERLYVGNRHYLRPLLPVLSGEGRFFLLALSEHDIKLFEATRRAMRPITIENLIPLNFRETMKTAYAESSANMYAGETPTAKPVRNSLGEAANKEVRDLREAFQNIDQGLMTILEGQRIPLVLAAPERLMLIYQDINSYPDMANFYVPGNPDEWEPEALHDLAWNRLKEHDRTLKDRHRKEFEGLLESGKAAVSTEEILERINKSGVHTLFVNRDAEEWGSLDASGLHFEKHEKRKKNSEDLLEAVAVKAYQKGARVFQVDASAMPHPESNLNAVWR